MKLTALFLGLCAIFPYSKEKIAGKYLFRTAFNHNVMELHGDFTYETRYFNSGVRYNSLYGAYHIVKDTLCLKSTHSFYGRECSIEKYLVAEDSLKKIWYAGVYHIDCTGGQCGSPKVEDDPVYYYIRINEKKD